MTPRHIEVRIDELVLRGFEPGDRYRIGDAAQRELSRLFTQHGPSPSLAEGGEAISLDAGTFEVPPGT